MSVIQICVLFCFCNSTERRQLKGLVYNLYGNVFSFEHNNHFSHHKEYYGFIPSPVVLQFLTRHSDDDSHVLV